MLSLLLIAYLIPRGTNPPNVPNEQGDTIKTEGPFFDIMITWSPILGTTACWFVIAVYTVIMLLQESGAELPGWCANPECIRLSSWSVTEFIGLVCLIAGCLLRLWCYHTLGRLFTFQVVIRENHHIVDVGPYALIRHPSYTALFLIAIGAHLFLMVGLFSCITAFHFRNRSETFFAVLIATFVAVIGRRVQNEEVTMYTKFGSAWEDYTRKTKRFVPFVL